MNSLLSIFLKMIKWNMVSFGVSSREECWMDEYAAMPMKSIETRK